TSPRSSKKQSRSANENALSHRSPRRVFDWQERNFSSQRASPVRQSDGLVPWRARTSTNQRLNFSYSVMILSAHSTNETKIFGLPNFAPYSLRSASVTPRTREQAPHA